MPAYFYSSEQEDVINYQEGDVWKCIFAGTPEFDAAVLAGVAPFQVHADPPEVPTSEDVAAERDRRILAGDVFFVSGIASPIPLRGDARTREYLSERGLNAGLKLLSGNAGATYFWRDAANVVHTLTAAQMSELAEAGANWIQAITKKSWDLKDDPEGIPVDFADDAYW